MAGINGNVPDTWTEGYVSANREECLITLQAHNLMAIEYLREENYLGALGYLGRIREGLVTMHNAECGPFGSHIASISVCEGMITAFGYFGMEVSERQRREEATTYLEYAEKRVVDEATLKTVQETISDFKSGMPLAHIRDKYIPDFPQALMDGLTDLNNWLSPY